MEYVELVRANDKFEIDFDEFFDLLVNLLSQLRELLETFDFVATGV